MEGDSGPSAFGVKLGISTGRHSPVSEPHTIMVNAETKVHWFFVEGAYILHGVHGRDSNQLQRDYDLYLCRPDKGDIVLQPLREIADYNIRRNDELQLRHKTLPITVYINLHNEDLRKIKVNSGFPVMDVVPAICEEFGIQNFEELSLAFSHSDNKLSKDLAGVNWLDISNSLNGQGVKDGDTLLLRKKFFILNDDIMEAIQGNQTLLDILYHQIHQQYVNGSYTGGGKELDRTLAMVSALLHHTEQGDENLSDEQAASKVMPVRLRSDHSLYEQIVTVYYQERVSTLQKTEAKLKLLKMFIQPQCILVTHYHVRFAEDSDDCVLTVDGDTITVCEEIDGKVKPLEGKCWRLRDIRDAEYTHMDEIVKLNVMGSWQELFSTSSTHIAEYVMEARKIVKKRAIRARMSARIPTPEAVGVITDTKEHVTASSPTHISRSPSPLEVVESTPPTEQKVKDPQFEWPIESNEEVLEEVEEVKPEQKPNDDNLLEDEQENKQNGEQEDNQAVLDDAKEDEVEEEDKTSSGASTPGVKRPVNVVITPLAPHSTPPPPNSPEKESPTKSLLQSTSKLVHIPQYLGLDYRNVMEDYKLFHIVVMKQDLRTLLLNIHKPVREVIESICCTFGISNPNEYHLWIPSGIQFIMEKYGGKPKRRAGKFLRRTSSSPGDFAPQLDVNKTLEDQYDFKIKPFLLHLRKYQNEEDVDAPDESTLDCGKEWPDFEHPDVARYRRFYQSWIGVVQGNYPIDRADAVKLAALLTHVYYGDRASAKVWPPRDYDPKLFLPAMHRGSFGISSDVEKAHKQHAGKTTQECIHDAVDCCRKLLTYQGVFFNVLVPVKSDIMVVIPWNKMEQRMFGINQRGIFSVDQNTSKVIFTHRFSDIYEWTSSENSFHLNFKEWAEDYNAYTFQTREILDVLELFIQMSLAGKIQQAPARPPSLHMEGPRRATSTSSAAEEDSLEFSKETSPGQASPKKASREVTQDTKPSRHESQDSKHSSVSSPTTYDALEV